MKDVMTLEGIGKENKGSIYRDYKNDTTGILYYEDKKNNLLIRQILPIAKDIQLVRETRKNDVRLHILVSEDKKILIPFEGVVREYSDDELKEIIRKANPLVNGEGAISVAIFNLKTKEFITILDVETVILDTGEEVGALTFLFSGNLMIRKRYGKKIRRWADNFFREAHIYTGGCREAIFNGKEYELIPIC